MEEKFDKYIKQLSRIIPYPKLDNTELLTEWKNRLLFVLLIALLFLGFFAYVPSAILSIKEKAWLIFGIDTSMYLVVLYVVFSKKMKAGTKIIISLAIFYVLGVALLVLLGKEGAGFNWFFMVPVISGFFYGYRGVAWATLITIFTFVLLTIIVVLIPADILLISEYGLGPWLVNSINFIAISTLISFSLAVIIYSIDNSLQKEKELTQLLQENQEKLAIEKDRAEEADRLKSTFLANMSHEIRTPMNSILGFSSLIGNPAQTPETIDKYKRLIQLSGEQLVCIIDDIIDISKIELNQMSVKLAPVPLFKCLKEVAEMQENKINSLGKNLNIQLVVSDEIKHLAIDSDEFRLKQILNNLVGNAIKYSDKGTITVGYKCLQEEKLVEFFVKDTGRGIPQNEQEKIFERFIQANNVDFKEGTGLGLSITKGLLQLLDGSIRVISKQGEGSEFIFTLPLSEKSAPAKVKPTQKPSLDFTGKLIYIAEDDIYSFYYLEELLKSTKVRLRHALNGKELLDFLAEQTPDLILLDINMPVMNGFQAIKEIRKTHPKLPVIAQTAYAMVEEQEKCFELGCNDIITKPIVKSDFFQLIGGYLIPGTED